MKEKRVEYLFRDNKWWRRTIIEEVAVENPGKEFTCVMKEAGVQF